MEAPELERNAARDLVLLRHARLLKDLRSTPKQSFHVSDTSRGRLGDRELLLRLRKARFELATLTREPIKALLYVLASGLAVDVELPRCISPAADVAYLRF